MNIPPKIIEWLHARGISDAVIQSHNMGWTDTHISIPICDLEGKFLFNKYRRDPFSEEEGPKYKYDYGTTAQLFNAHLLNRSSCVHIVEGEMDALALESKGYVAVSTTGGAGTWKDEWTELLAGKEIFICYDNDEAGVKGAVKLLTKMPGKLVLIPREKKIKDITDYLVQENSYQYLLERAESFTFLSMPMPELNKIKEIRDYIGIINQYLDRLLGMERQAKNFDKPFYHYDVIKEVLSNAKDRLNRKIRRIQYMKEPANIEGNENGKISNADILRAKDVPLENLIELNAQSFAHCPFHGKDKTPSLRVYRNQNRFYCYGCSAGNDVIDFIMKQEKCNFIEAVKFLLKK